MLCPTVQWLYSAVSNFKNFGQCSVKLYNGWTVLCPTVQWLVNAVSNCPMAGELSVSVQWLDCALSDCPMVGQCCGSTVQRSDKALSNCPMVGQCCVLQSNCKSIICQTVQWSESAVSYSPILSQFSVKLSNGWSAECSTVKWSDCALSNCSMVKYWAKHQNWHFWELKEELKLTFLWVLFSQKGVQPPQEVFIHQASMVNWFYLRSLERCLKKETKKKGRHNCNEKETTQL